MLPWFHSLQTFNNLHVKAFIRCSSAMKQEITPGGQNIKELHNFVKN